MAMTLKPGEVAVGSLSSNTRKTKPSQPDFTGQVNTPMGLFRLSIWDMTNSQTGGRFISFSVTEAGTVGTRKGQADYPEAQNTSLAGAFDAILKTPPEQPKPTRRKKGADNGQG